MRVRLSVGFAAFTAPKCSRLSYSTKPGNPPHGIRAIAVLGDANLDTFRKQAFEPARPFLLPRSSYQDLPAIRKWFLHIPTTHNKKPTSPKHHHDRITLNREYFLPFGSTRVPLEITNNNQFARLDSTLSFFLECVQASSSKYIRAPSRYFSSYVPGARPIKRLEPLFAVPPAHHDRPTGHSSGNNEGFFSTKKPLSRVYLAQASIADLPRVLRQDLPTPHLVQHAGRGDVYDSSVWLGDAPTYTPLHRDPNPNLLVQLAGTKIVRLMTPENGEKVFARVQEEIGGVGRARMRGEEMMQGEEKVALEKAVWEDDDGGGGGLSKKEEIWQAKLYAGDALFIPKGWWHSVKGVGHGMTGSANWWFR